MLLGCGSACDFCQSQNEIGMGIQNLFIGRYASIGKRNLVCAVRCILLLIKPAALDG